MEQGAFLAAFEQAGFHGIEILKRDVQPWRTAAARGAKVTIELPVGGAAGLEPGDRLVLDA